MTDTKSDEERARAFAVDWHGSALAPVDYPGTVKGYLAGIAAERERTRWIPVSEQMPPSGQRVIVCVDNRDADNTIFVTTDWSLERDWPYWRTYGKRVTHWMPLPSAPGTEEGGK